MKDDTSIYLRCMCGGKHCYGEMMINHDELNGDKVLSITVVDGTGNEEGSMWLSKDQVEHLVEQLSIMKGEM